MNTVMNAEQAQPGFFKTWGPVITTTVGCLAGAATVVGVAYNLKDRPKMSEFETMKSVVENHSQRLVAQNEAITVLQGDVKGLGVKVDSLGVTIAQGFSRLNPMIDDFNARQQAEQVRHAVGGAGLTKAAFDNVPRQQPRRKQPARPVAARRSENRRTSAVVS